MNRQSVKVALARFAIVLLSGFAAESKAGDIYVAVGGSGDGSSGESPLATIASAITAANAAIGAGEDQMTIHLAAGTYQERDLNLTEGIRIVGDGPTRDDVIVQASGTASDAAVKGHRVFRLNHPRAVLANLTVRNGWWVTNGKRDQSGDFGANGGNVLIFYGGTVTNCVLDSGRVEHTADALINGALGGNLYIFDSGLAVDCDIANGVIYNVNNAGGGGNVVMHGGGRLVRCTVRNGHRQNEATSNYDQSGGSGIYMNGPCVAENCLVRGNSGTRGAVALFAGAPRLVNCTVVGNSSGYGGRNGVWVNTADARVVNCVMFDNGGTAVAEWGDVNADAFVNCVAPQGAAISGGSNNFQVTSQAFADEDYRPVGSGPQAALVCAGTSDADYAAYGATSELDLDGTPRSHGGGLPLDVGCYAAANVAPLSVRGTVRTELGITQAFAGDAFIFSATAVSGMPVDEVTFHWDFGDGETLDTTDALVTYRYESGGWFTVVVSATGGGVSSDPRTIGAVEVLVKDYYVAPGGTDGDEHGMTSDDPFATLGFAVGRVSGFHALLRQDMDVTIHLAAGTYQERDLNLADGIRIVGEGATRDDVIVQASAMASDAAAKFHRVFRLAHPQAALANLTVRNGWWETRGETVDNGANGGNVLIYGGGTVTNCVLDAGRVDHTADGLIPGALGGNLYIYNSGLAVDCDIVNGTIWHSGTCGGGGNVVLHGEGARLMRCTVRNGHRFNNVGDSAYSQSGGSGIYMNGSCVAENCLIRGNSGTRGAVALYAGAPRLVNCTVVENFGGYGGMNGVWVNTADARVVNCVMYGNGGTDVAEWAGVNGGTFVRCAVPTGVAITDGIGTVCATDQSFVDPLGHDYHPLIGDQPVLFASGTTVEEYATYGAISTADMDGSPRWQGQRLDIGCFAAVRVEDVLVVRGQVSSTLEKSGTVLALEASVESGWQGEVTFHWDFGDGETLDTTESQVTHRYDKPGLHGITLYGTSGTVTSALVAVESVRIMPSDYYVAPGGSDVDGGGCLPENPFGSIGFALSQLSRTGQPNIGDVTIHLAAGTYQERDLNLTEGIRIVGDGPTRDDVIVQASAMASDAKAKFHRVFRLAHPQAVLANLTVRNGWWETKGKDYDNGANGGNVLIYGGGTVTNCVLDSGRVDHTADGLIAGALGGNLYIYNGGLAVDCDIVNGTIWHSATCGGGGNVVLHGEGARLMRCTVRNGHRFNDVGDSTYTESGGSGIYMTGACVAENCLIQGNSGTGGAVLLCAGAPRLVNCTVVENFGGFGGRNGVWVKTADARVVNCVMYGNGGTNVAEWAGDNGASFVRCAVPEGVAITDGSGTVCATDQAFVDPSGHDYRPARGGKGSVLRNAGTAAVDYESFGAVSKLDLDRKPRIAGRRLEIGCYESPGPGLCLMVR